MNMIKHIRHCQNIVRAYNAMHLLVIATLDPITLNVLKIKNDGTMWKLYLECN